MDDFTPAPLPVCGRWVWLPERQVPAAVAYAPAGAASADDVDRDLRCGLQAHATGRHLAYVMDLDGRDTGSVWAGWEDGGVPVLAVLPDCPACRPPGDACCLYGEHPGGHSYELADPWLPGRS
jgi:hypothetical protein